MRPTLTLLLALAATTTLTPPTFAQNPLAKPKAPAARPFVGTFQADDLKLELRWNDAQSNYRGKLTTGDSTLDVEATEQRGVLTGKFRVDGASYEFTLQAKGSKFVLRSDGEDHELTRQEPKDAPKDAPAPANPNDAPGGVGIAFLPQDGKLVVAQLAPGSPAEKAKVPTGAILRAVDGKRVDGVDLDQVRNRIRGAIGTMVTVTLETDTEVLDYVLQRAALAANGGPAPTPQPPEPGRGGYGNGGNAGNGGNGAPGIDPAPAAGNGALPAWLKAGMRATFYSGTAQLPGVSTTLVEDDNGNWVDDQGRKYSQQQVQGSGGAGFTQYDFVHVTPECLAVANTNFVFADAQLATVARGSASGFLGDQNGLGDVWIHPAKLRAMQEQESPGYRVRRLRYPLDGRTYDAITLQTKAAGSFTRYTYDQDTGLMLVHSMCTTGKAALTPNANGTSSYGGGVTTIVHGHLRSLRALQLPWLGQRTPPGLQAGQQLHFPGSCRNSLGDGIVAPWRYQFDLAIDRRSGECLLATIGSTLDYGTGAAPQQSSNTMAYGPGSAIPLWLDAKAVQRLQPGQVLDTDPLTRTEIGFGGSDGQTAVLFERSPLESQSYTYDLRSGQLVACSVRVKSGPATLSYDVQLAR